MKDDHGADTLDAAALDTVLTAVRAVAPEVPVGVTTGTWALPNADARVAAVRSWRQLAVLPDFASVSWHEDGADEVAAAQLGIGVGVEAGVWHAAAAWLALRVAGRLGLSTRIGLEDVLVLPDGSTASGNAALVRAARDLLAGANRSRGAGNASAP